MARGSFTSTQHILDLHEMMYREDKAIYSNRYCAKKLSRSTDWVKKYINPSYYVSMIGTFLH